jgi:hypothetical protein
MKRDEWVAKKPQVYCRPHGRRVVGFLMGWGGLCKVCEGELKDALGRIQEIPHQKH